MDFAVLGYMLTTLKNVADGQTTPLPEWGDFGNHFMKGLYAFIGLIVYLLPALVLLCCAGIVGVAGSAAAGAAGRDTAGLAGVVGILATCVQCVGYLIYFVLFIWNVRSADALCHEPEPTLALLGFPRATWI